MNQILKKFGIHFLPCFFDLFFQLSFASGGSFSNITINVVLNVFSWVQVRRLGCSFQNFRAIIKEPTARFESFVLWIIGLVIFEWTGNVHFSIWRVWKVSDYFCVPLYVESYIFFTYFLFLLWFLFLVNSYHMYKFWFDVICV